jgi:DNA-binding MarR family transcriptional regulator
MANDKLVLDRFIPYRLSVASNAVSGLISESYRKRFGLKISEWRIIAILAEGEQMTPQMLTEATRMDKIAVSRAATNLVERGLVDMFDNPGDRRSHFLRLTDVGRSLYAEIVPAALAMESALFSALTPDECATLETLLRRVEHAAHRQGEVL